MSDELWQTLLRFHREVALPDMEERITVPLRDEMAAFRRETNAHFNAIYARLDRVDALEEKAQQHENGSTAGGS